MGDIKDRGQRGFFLLELVIMVGIMAAAGAYFLPRAMSSVEDRLNTFWLEQEAQLLAEDVRYMEQLAMNYRRVNSTFPSAASEALPYISIRKSGYRLIQGSKTLRSRDFAAAEEVTVTCSRTSNRLEYDANSANTATVGLTRKGISRYVIVDREGRVRISQSKPGS